VREDLNAHALRRLGVLRPLKVVIENWPEGKVEMLEAVNNPEDPEAGTRQVPFSGELWIERTDFREEAPRKYFRLVPGREVRLRYGYFITCVDYVKDEATGEVTELRCTYDPETKGGYAPDGRKVRGTIHWVSAAHAIDAEVRLYGHLFSTPDPGVAGEGKTWLDNVDPDSIEVLEHCKLEPSLAEVAPGGGVQFERQGYFCADSADSKPGKPVFNRTVSLRDTWAKIERKQKNG